MVAFKRYLSGCLVVVGLAFSVLSEASVIVSGTRVIYPADMRDISVNLTNNGETPSLVQVWIDRGDPDSTPDDADVPFFTTPPVMRIDAGQGQAIRIASLGAAGPLDRESVFWLNVLAVPASDASAASGNHLQLAYRTRIKLFYRPAGLTGSPEEAPAALRWGIEPGQADVLDVDNDSAYSVSLARIRVSRDGRVVASAEGRLVPAHGHQRFVLAPTSNAGGRGDRVEFSWINDYGVPQTLTADL